MLRPAVVVRRIVEAEGPVTLVAKFAIVELICDCPMVDVIIVRSPKERVEVSVAG